MSRIREIKEGMQFIGVDERPTFTLTTTPWGSTPTSIQVKAFLYDEDDGTYTDKSADCFPSGSPSAVGDVITLPVFVPQAIGDNYRIEVKFTAGGSVWEAYAWVKTER